MISLTENQQIIIESQVKEIAWLFKIGPLQWSTQAVSFESENYEPKIIAKSFSGIRLNRAKQELGIQTVDAINFDVMNVDGALVSDNIIGGRLVIKLLVTGYGQPSSADAWGHGDEWGLEDEWSKPMTPAFTDILGEWHFDVTEIGEKYGVLKVTAKDILEQYLEGDYPTTPLITDLDSGGGETDQDCVPVCFGSCFFPLPCITYEDALHYVLGKDTGNTYTIEKVRSPKHVEAISTWLESEHTFSLSVGTINGLDYHLFQPLIADGDVGVWKNGARIAGLPAKFTDSHTVAMTSPADIIAYVLKDMGIDPALVDDGQGGSFAAAKAVYETWGLTWEFGFFKKEARNKVLPALLNACNSVLKRSNGVFKLAPLTKASVKTMTSASILQKTFNRQTATTKKTDVAGFRWQVPDIPQDKLIFGQVSINNDPNPTRYSSDVIELPYIQDSQHGQWVARLYYIRKLYRGENLSFSTKGRMAAVEPDDVITISGSLYGGTYDVLVDQVHIASGLSVNFQATKYIIPLQDYKDTTAPEIIITEESISGNVDTVITYQEPINITSLPNSNPSSPGLWLNGNYMGYFNTAWVNYLRNNGAFRLYADANHYLQFDGTTWTFRSDLAATDKAGLMPTLSAVATQFLNGQGQWTDILLIDDIDFNDGISGGKITSGRGFEYPVTNMTQCTGVSGLGIQGGEANPSGRYMDLDILAKGIFFMVKRLDTGRTEFLLESDSPAASIVIDASTGKIGAWDGTQYRFGNGIINETTTWHEIYIQPSNNRLLDTLIDIYLDGSRITPDTSFQWDDQDLHIDRIGRYTATPGYGAPCFDNVKIYNHRLSPDEIAAI